MGDDQTTQRKHLEHQVKTLTSVIATLRELADKEKHNPIHGVHSRLKGTSNNDDFVVGSTAVAARRSFSLLIWRGYVSAFCGRCPVQDPSVGLLRYAAATIRSSVTSRRIL